MKNGAILQRAGMLFWLSGWLTCLGPPSAQAQLFSNLASLVYEIPVGDPVSRGFSDGPKGIDSADFDGDGKEDFAVSNTDGSVTVYFGKGGGRFAPPLHLHTTSKSLRGLVCADINNDGLPDIVVAAPYASQVFIILNLGERNFRTPTTIPAWYGVRNVATGDFNGDGLTDLVLGGPNNGVRQLRNAGGGTFEIITNFIPSSFSFPEQSKFPKPVYSMVAYREPGALADVLVATHAETNVVWLLRPDSHGALQLSSVVTNRAPAHSLGIGALLSPRLGPPDLICVERDAGILEIHGANGNGFSSEIAQRIDVPGGPRAVQVVDLNGDNWNDLVVVQRNFDSIITFVNSNGVFYPAAERPVGVSPRELVSARFDSDQFPDVAVMNRRSADVSILLASPGTAGFRGVNHLYLVDGNVVGLAVSDFNGDGRDDVIQLHRASGDFSVRLANPDGTLAPPVYYTVGNVPSSQVFADVNNDGIADQLTANLGTAGIEKGSVSVRLGNGNGTFGAERRFELPADVEGRLFALVPVDLDGDGNIDLAAGFLDSRIAFFRGLGNGDFQFTRAHPFVAQSRALLAGDFDHNGTEDLVGVGASGEVWIVENRGDLLTAIDLAVETLPAPADGLFVRRALLTDDDGDGELDLVIGNASGALVYRGTGGLVFDYPPLEIAAANYSTSDVLLADLDQDGNKDLIMSCRDLDCISIFAPQGDGSYAYAASLDAPATQFIATGDLDGDGKPDLVGTGRILWTALSGHPPQATPPLALTGSRTARNSVVINELLANNTNLPLDSDGGHTDDWVEIYNGTESSYPLNGWRLRLTGPTGTGAGASNEFAFPPTAFLAPRKHLLVYCSTTKRTIYHTGFNLRSEGGTLSLLNNQGQEVDRVEYPAQEANVSYARFRDALYSFAFNPFPSPGRANVPNGLVEPSFHFGGVEPSTFGPGHVMRFFAEIHHEVGIASASLIYQRLDQPNMEVQQLPLYDDGAHGDGAAGDGLFACDLEGSFPAEAEIQFYFEVTDLNDQVMQIPDDPEFGFPGDPGNAFQIALATNRPPLELSEVVPFNNGSLFDETGGTPDWVEVRNTSGVSIPMDGITLSHDLGDGDRYYWPTGAVLRPGEHFVVFCDNNPGQGSLHAPFRLDRNSDTLVLSGLTTNKSRTLVDWTHHGVLGPDVGWARVGAGGNWRSLRPTPRACNIPGLTLSFLETNSMGVHFTFAFPTTTNGTYLIEKAAGVESGAAWQTVETLTGNGIEKAISAPVAGGKGFFRVKKDVP